MTHELKTPIATIRAIGDSLTTGRIAGPSVVPRYGQLVTNEAKRLGRLVDNVLAFSRITDVADVYSFDSLSIAEVVDDVLRDLATVISGRLPRLRWRSPGRSSGARRPSRTAPSPRQRAGQRDQVLVGDAIDCRDRGYETPMVVVTVSDKGASILARELDQVTRRSFRGSGAPPGGNGLGLAIVKKIVDDHEGALQIQSVEGKGTTVVVSLCAAEGVA